MQIGSLELILILVIMAAGIYFICKNFGCPNETHTSATAQSTYSSIVSQTPVVNQKSSDIEATQVSTPKLAEHYLRFLYAVAVIQDINGQGSIRIKRSENGSTLQLSCHYCNYSCISCRHVLTQDGALRFSELQIDPGDEDSISYIHEAIPFEEWEFGLPYLMHEPNTALPSVSITGQTVRNDFISVQFRT